MAELMLASPKEKLLAEFDELESAIEDAAINPTWRLADWLAANVPNGAQGVHVPRGTSALTLDDLEARSRWKRSWLQRLRKVATDAPREIRVEGVSPRVTMEAIKVAKGDVATAMESLQTKNTLRSFAPSQDIESARRILENPETRSSVIERASPEAQVQTFEKLIEAPAVREALEARPDLRTRTDQAVERAHDATHEPLPRLAPDRYWSLEGQLFQAFTKLYWAYSKVQDGSIEPERRDGLIRQAEQAADWASALAALLKGESPARELLDDIDAMLQEARGNV